MELIADNEAYSDFAGYKDLSKYDPENCIQVPTTVAEYAIAVKRNEDGDFVVYLIHDRPRHADDYSTPENNAVAIVYLTGFGAGMFSPSSYVLPEYRGQRYTCMLYRWILDSGIVLITHGTQSHSAHRLWISLSQSYTLLILRCYDDTIVAVGEKARKNYSLSRYTECILLEPDVDLAEFAKSYGYKVDLDD